VSRRERVWAADRNATLHHKNGNTQAPRGKSNYRTERATFGIRHSRQEPDLGWGITEEESLNLCLSVVFGTYILYAPPERLLLNNIPYLRRILDGSSWCRGVGFCLVTTENSLRHNWLSLWTKYEISGERMAWVARQGTTRKENLT
jgi:hypothetical protein